MTSATAPPTTASSSPTAGRLRIADLVILSVGTFTLGVDGFVLSGLLPQVAGSLHVSASTAGQLTTLFALVYAVGSPIIATVAGNWDRRALLAAGMTVFLGGVAVQAVGTTFAEVAAGRVVAALGAAGYQATAYSTAGILSDDEHRARSLAVVAGGSSVAIVAGLPFGIVIGQTWGWRSAMWVLVVLAALSTALLVALPPTHAPRLSAAQRLRALTDRRVLAVLAGTVTTLTPSFVIVAYLPATLNSAGWTVVAAMLCYGAGQVAGTTLVPRIIRRLGAPRTLLVAATALTVTTAALTATRLLAGAAFVTVTGVGLAVGLAVVPQQHRIFTGAPEHAGVAVGLNGSAIYIASALGAGLGGLALAVGGAAAPSLAAALVGVAAVLIAFRFRR